MESRKPAVRCQECNSANSLPEAGDYGTAPATVCSLCTRSIEYKAKQAAGNWKRFESFVWYSSARPENPELWAIFYTSNRDSSLLAQSNAAAIAKRMQPFVENGTALEESASHWAVGYVDGFAVQVYTAPGSSEITAAFREWFEINEQLERYPVLNDDDYSERQAAAAFESWRLLGLRGRIEICAANDISIFAARRADELPRDDDGSLFEALTADC